ncbi:MAG: YceH family protein [Pseudomonadota bacterium]
MLHSLTDTDLRIIGCLIEKSITTPEYYPMSINSLTNACNQKSNREPVLSLTEIEVKQSIESLIHKGAVEVDEFSSRVPKYHQRFCNTEFSQLQLTEQELGILCVLFLRGPQTPGEIRSRTSRLCHFKDVAETEQCLQSMITHSYGGLVTPLPREPGKREVRFKHQFSEINTSETDQSEPQQFTKAQPDNLQKTLSTEHSNELDAQKLLFEKLLLLEERVEQLEIELQSLKQHD